MAITDKQLPNNTLSVITSRHTDWACAIFVKITFVYGQIDENGPSVRKWHAPKMAITDKMVKNGGLSVKIKLFQTLFYGQMLQKAGFVRKSSS